MMIRPILLLALAAVPVLAQNGDHAGEVQAERVPAHLIPPAPVLSPEDQIKTFRLPPGFAAEIVAAEPLVTTPVSAQFDHRGRLWVVEMNGYMPTPDAAGERVPSGNIVILTDTDGDGRMDRRTVFLGGLVMPRSVMLLGDGALVAEPPRLWFAHDRDGDGVCDAKEVVADDYATQDDPKLGEKANPEHASNSPTWAMDNWIYSANHTVRLRWNGGTNWLRRPTIFRGQWGLSQDDAGRLYHNSNSDALRGDLVPSEYLDRNPNLRQPYGANVQLERDQRVFPVRVNPGVNRGYQPGQLREDGRLATFTGACGPAVYRGDQFPEEYRGDVFFCEPTGNFVRRERIVERDGVLSATNAVPGGEFLASTDERFRPVNLLNGPDGCLYVVDIARGLIQHRIYLTSYLRKQVESRNLQVPVNLGRIYRIVDTRRPRAKTVAAELPGTDELLALLSHPNGWWRDRAQQMLVERRDASVAPRLRGLVLPEKNPSAPGRLHALWTLEGIGQVDLPTLDRAVQDPSTKVRVAALRLIEPFLQGPTRQEASLVLLRRAGFLPGAEQVQLFLTMTALKTQAADTILRVLLMNSPASPLRYDAVASGLGGRELEFLEGLVADPVCGPDKKEHAGLVRRLAECVAVEGKIDRVEHLLHLAGNRRAGDWQQLAMLDGLLSIVPVATKGRPAPAVRGFRFAAQPVGWAALKLADPQEVRARVQRLEPLVGWEGDGKAAPAPLPVATKLSADEEASFTRGKDLYAVVCGACHQPHGNGQEGLAPPLRDSEWVLGSEQRNVRIALHGLRDPVTVKGRKWELNMPALGEALDDQQIADALTYIRREWGHTVAPVTAATVKAVRAATAKREDSWTEAELLRVP
ncbi:MAG: c-type cytochrome [Verrucomicrobia bacterium]|nr:MAG: c-type cytochrome [Verrucomicrobiota bacterium]